ncbi:MULTISPECIES: nitrogen regulation protein NR(II) [Methylococcus]|uniref:Sensory histidine kinase/phosphatase NtrB n=1 Tax=Methylococcus capsulatus TaxID=414 RepID=A0ABZ2FA77_METCP|nr:MULTISPECIES: nitrogen regulation protein NR(II) [Methylococcus]MDF9391188.1 nitrogen regulation protein NR(II) [Methylococcus capsulatus]
MTASDTPSFFRRILDNLGDGVLLFDNTLTLTYINMPGEMLLAVSARQVLGVRARLVLPCSEQPVEPDMRHALDTGISLTKRNVTLVHPLHVITVNLHISPITEDEASGVLVQVQQVDRHLRISMEEQLLAQQNAAKSLLKGLAHEIKNPLGGLRGAAQLLERELHDELREYTQIIIEESDRLQSLLDRMLGPNKLPQKAWLNIHRVLDRVTQLVQVEVPAGVRIVRDYDPSIPEIFGDADQLIQAILNIVRNAAQALGMHGRIIIRSRIDRQVTIGERRHRMAVKIDIIDDGPGIKPELLNHIFYPMVTGRAEGTGLGLSIAQGLINQHGGLIECSSVPGNTVFSIFLPLEEDHEANVPGLGSR